MTTPETFALAQRIAALEAGQRGRAPQLAFSTLEAGAITVTDEFDGLRGAVGVQYDGSVMVAELAQAPAPLQPTPALLSTGAGSLKVRWDGLWANGLVTPMNFTRVEIHIAATPGDPADTAATLYGTFETPRGGEQSFAMPPGAAYVRLVARNLSGDRGLASVETTVTVPPILGADELAGIQTDVDAANAAATQAQTDAAAAQTAAAGAVTAASDASTDAAAALSAANAAQADVDAIPAQIATAKSEAISAAAITAQDKADLAQAAAIAASLSKTAGSVTSTYIADDAITTPKIATNAVTADEILAGAVIAGKLAANSVIAGTIAADVVTTTTLAADAVTATKLAVDAVIARNVKAGEIIAGKLAVNSVIAGNIATDAVTTNTLVADAVTAAKIAVDAVVARNIKAGEVIAGKLAVDSVLAGNIKAGEVIAGKLAALSVIAGTIAADAVTANTIAAGAIEAGKLAVGAVIAGNIAAGAVTATSLSADAIDGKTITGSILRTASAGGRIVARPGLSSLGYGNGILEFFSGNVGEETPGEIYTISDGPNPADNTSLYIMAPKKTGYSQRSYLQLFASDADTNASLVIGGAVVSMTVTQNVKMWIGGVLRLQVDSVGVTLAGNIVAQGDIQAVGGTSLPRGIAASSTRTTNTAAIGTTSGTATSFFNVTVPVVTGRRYKATLQWAAQSTVAADRIAVRVLIAGTQVNLVQAFCSAANTSFAQNLTNFYTATSTGNITFEFLAYRSAGTGNAIIPANGAQPVNLEIEDTGSWV